MSEELSAYEKLKKWCVDHKKEFIIAGCFVLVFLVGFGTGRYDREAQSAKRKSLTNYSKTNVNQQKAADAAVENQDANTGGQVAGEATGDKAKADGKCVIKGNISTTGMIYHMPGGASYEKTNPEKCFNTEAEAKAAGFRKAAR